MSATTWIDFNKILKNKVLVSSMIGLFSFFSLKAIISYIRKCNLHSAIENTRNKARTARDLKIDKFLFEHKGKVNQDKQNKILEANITLLVTMIKTKKVSCEEVFLTYAIRAGTIGRELNLIADVDFENGYRTALESDRMVREDCELGVLHGVPVSFYEQISVKGLLTTCGYASYSQNVNIHDSLIVSILRKEGAIPFVKSNVPQGFMALEASNSLWGKAKNPWNLLKTTGGSNGGECGLVSARCSPFGIGGDLFGSIRIPSSFCGVYGFKPTSTRNSKRGAILFNGRSFTGFNTFSTSWGPICKSIDDLILISKCLFGKYTEDVYVNNTPFDEQSFSRVIDNNNYPCKIGYFKEIKEFPTAPAIKDAMTEAMHYLKTNGYHLIEFPIDKFEEFIQTGLGLLINSETVNFIKKELKGEELEVYYKNLNYLTSKDNCALAVVSSFKSMMGKHREAKVISQFKNMTKSDFIEANVKFSEMKEKFIEYWKDNDFRAILSPIFPTLALDFGDSQEFLPYNNMAYIYNFADLPAVTIPLRTNENTLYTDSFNDSYSEIAVRNMKTSIKLPIGIQVGGLPNQDEWVLRLAKEIDYFFRFDQVAGTEMMKRYPVPFEEGDQAHQAYSVHQAPFNRNLKNKK